MNWLKVGDLVHLGGWPKNCVFIVRALDLFENAFLELQHPNGLAAWYQVRECYPCHGHLSRKLADIGANSISEAKQNMLNSFRDDARFSAQGEADGFYVIADFDLSGPGRWMMRRLVREGYAKEVGDIGGAYKNFIVTAEKWDAEVFGKVDL